MIDRFTDKVIEFLLSDNGKRLYRSVWLLLGGIVCFWMYNVIQLRETLSRF